MVKFTSRTPLAIAAVLAAAAPATGFAQTAGGEIPRAASTPGTPKNWIAPSHKIRVQAVVDTLIATHPEIMSITIHALPKGQPADAYTMIAGSFPDRVGNTSSPGDIITAKKGVTQVESKWGTPDYGKKVSVVLPLEGRVGQVSTRRDRHCVPPVDQFRQDRYRFHAARHRDP